MATASDIVLQVAVNGGAPQTGGIEVDFGASLVLSLQNPAGVKKLKYEIFDYPEGWPAPTGWASDSDTGRYFVTTNGASAPAITLPTDSSLWGKFMFSAEANDRLRDGAVADDLFDDSTAAIIFSPRGLRDVAYLEGGQFNQQRRYVGELKRMIRAIETMFNDGSFSRLDTASVSQPSIIAQPSLGAGGSTQISGSDASGSITLVRGTGGSSGLQATINLSQEYSAQPQCKVFPVGASSALSTAIYYATAIDNGSIGLYAAATPEDSVTHDLGYHIIGGGSLIFAPTSDKFLSSSISSAFFGTDFVFTKPPGTTLNVVLVARVLIVPGTNSSAISITPPAGWTLRLRTDWDSDGASQAIYTKVAGGSEPSSYTFVIGAPVYCDGDMLAYVGIDTAAPWQTQSGAAGASQVAIGTGVTVANNASVLLHWLSSLTTARTSGPVGFANRAFYDSVVYSDEKTVNTGATGNISSIYPSSQSWVSQLGVLKPAP